MELHKETRFLIQANRTAYEWNLRELKRRSHGKLFGKYFFPLHKIPMPLSLTIHWQILHAA